MATGPGSKERAVKEDVLGGQRWLAGAWGAAGLEQSCRPAGSAVRRRRGGRSRRERAWAQEPLQVGGPAQLPSSPRRGGLASSLPLLLL